jgi:hypothetical protein
MQKLYNPSFSIGKRLFFQRLFHGAIQARGSFGFFWGHNNSSRLSFVGLCFLMNCFEGMLLICSLLFTIIHLFLWLIVFAFGPQNTLLA